MNNFVKKLLEFADFCGNIDDFDASPRNFGLVNGVLRDGSHRFTISVNFIKIEEEQDGD